MLFKLVFKLLHLSKSDSSLKTPRDNDNKSASLKNIRNNENLLKPKILTISLIFRVYG